MIMPAPFYPGKQKSKNIELPKLSRKEFMINKPKFFRIEKI